MQIDYNLVRRLLLQVQQSAPFPIKPELPVVDIQNDPLKISMKIPTDEGIEFKHWRFIWECKLIRVTHNGRPGFGSHSTRVEALTAQGIELLELSAPKDSWTNAVSVCSDAKALSLRTIRDELRHLASQRISKTRQIRSN